MKPLSLVLFSVGLILGALWFLLKKKNGSSLTMDSPEWKTKQATSVWERERCK